MELGATLFDLGDLAVTGVRYLLGEASGEELAVTAAGTAAGVALPLGGAGRAARATARARRLGAAGEAAVRSAYDIGQKTSIRVAGRTRIPDGLTRSVLTEVKNVKELSFTSQLQDYLKYARDNNLRFDLFVRGETELSAPLQELVRGGFINLRRIPGD